MPGALSSERAMASLMIPWVLAALLLLCLALPVGALLVRALGAESGWDARTFVTLRQALRVSLLTTVLSMAVIVVLGTPLAFLLARRRIPGAIAVEALVDL